MPGSFGWLTFEFSRLIGYNHVLKINSQETGFELLMRKLFILDGSRIESSGEESIWNHA